MRYKKPRDVRYVDMCIWIDEHAYGENCDEQKMFEYVYLLSNMLARKRCFFRKEVDYDNFAFYVATETFMRYKKQDRKKIKSILNYLKKVIYPRKVAFLETELGRSVPPEERAKVEASYCLKNAMEEATNFSRITEFDCTLHDVPRTIRAFMSKIPTSRYDAEWENVYVSCLLSFANAITLSKDTIQSIASMDERGRAKEKPMVNWYKNARDNCVILYHLDNNYYDYVKTLTNILMRLVAKDISEVVGSDVYADDYATVCAVSAVDLTGGVGV